MSALGATRIGSAGGRDVNACRCGSWDSTSLNTLSTTSVTTALSMSFPSAEYRNGLGPGSAPGPCARRSPGSRMRLSSSASRRSPLLIKSGSRDRSISLMYEGLRVAASPEPSPASTPPTSASSVCVEMVATCLVSMALTFAFARAFASATVSLFCRSALSVIVLRPPAAAASFSARTWLRLDGFAAAGGLAARFALRAGAGLGFGLGAAAGFFFGWTALGASGGRAFDPLTAAAAFCLIRSISAAGVLVRCLPSGPNVSNT